MPSAPASGSTTIGHPSPPVARLQAIAATAKPDAAREYQPSEADVALAGALFSTYAPSFLALARAAGLSESTVLRVKQDPARAAWVVNRAAELAELAKGAVYSRLAEMALTSNNPAWLKLFLERFDEIYRKSTPGATHNTQVNVYGSYSDAELKALIAQKSRQVFGAESAAESNKASDR